MALDLLTQQTVQVVDGDGLNWEDAIRQAAQPLVDNGTVGDDYVEAMIDVVKDKGPYINIGPNIALAHSRPRASVKRIGLSLMKTNQPVNLVSDEHPVKLWFVLAATDSTSHLKVIQELSTVLMDADRTKKLLAATSVDDVLAILKD
ncbi:MAG TPA: PTS sugar transporter subunit IIA [Candidatus Limosilactobacillus merdipullorum]|uniref:Ascorbate-specific PTS system EIIA component n=1 Tax=Candidatus Limosilactobacillus merdipullorum TaxID=2838653 RepID=A0A9D1U364_9LACO|nr:PTS sugar transporter subunit IIA [Candidatus Limosilactobacillus merdipullorum]